MTDAEMIKAMEICKDKEIPCDDCPLVKCGDCEGISRQYFYDRFNELKSENAALRERLRKAVELPVKVRDKLYRFDGTEIIEYQVSTITLLSNGNCKIRLSYQLPVYKSRSIHEIRACDIGNNYFTTQAEACFGRGG